MTTTAEIKIALRQRYAAPEWALLFEVGDATGARHTRFADALAMSLWPSRGLTLHGMEIKVSRSDWKRERANPEKAETIAAYCDYWSLVTAKGVVLDPDEIPPAWGWLEFDGVKFVRRRDETRTEAQPISRAFLAALLRRADKTNETLIDAEVKRRTASAEDAISIRVDEEVRRRAERNSKALTMVEEFEKASGVKLGPGWAGDYRPEDVGRTLKAILASDLQESYLGCFHLAELLRDASEKIERAMIENGFSRAQKGR